MRSTLCHKCIDGNNILTLLLHGKWFPHWRFAIKRSQFICMWNEFRFMRSDFCFQRDAFCIRRKCTISWQMRSDSGKTKSVSGWTPPIPGQISSSEAWSKSSSGRTHEIETILTILWNTKAGKMSCDFKEWQEVPFIWAAIAEVSLNWDTAEEGVKKGIYRGDRDGWGGGCGWRDKKVDCECVMATVECHAPDLGVRTGGKMVPYSTEK